jgi:hypothetical protein
LAEVDVQPFKQDLKFVERLRIVVTVWNQRLEPIAAPAMEDLGFRRVSPSLSPRLQGKKSIVAGVDAFNMKS